MLETKIGKSLFIFYVFYCTILCVILLKSTIFMLFVYKFLETREGTTNRVRSIAEEKDRQKPASNFSVS
jgi:cell division protein FtsL